MDEAPSVVDMDDESAVGRDDEEEDEPPAPKKLRREVAALQSSPPPQPVASSSKSRITPSPGKAQPLASSSKVTLSKMPVPYVAVPSSDLKVSLHCFGLFFKSLISFVFPAQTRPLDLVVPTAAAASAHSDACRGTHPGDAPHLACRHASRDAVEPSGQYVNTLSFLLPETYPSSHVDWVRGNAQPLPTTQLVPSSFVQDGLVPALYSQAPFKCHTCINSKKRCHFRGMNSSCEECHTGKHNCSIVANPTRFLQNIEELRPMINLGPEGAYRFHNFFALLTTFLA
jgi:hypothetical protein